jgi:hypothetical protein
MQAWLPMAITAVVTILASSGFWAWVQSGDKTRTATSKLLMGLAYDKLVTLGLQHIERGSITKDELEAFRVDLYEPYKALGGNGIAEKIAEDVLRLPLVNHNRYSQIDRADRNSVRELSNGERNPHQSAPQ